MSKGLERFKTQTDIETDGTKVAKMTTNFSETGGATLYGDARYDADLLLEWLRETRETIGTLRHDFGMFHIDSLLGLDVATKVTETPEFTHFEEEYSFIVDEFDAAEDHLIDAINLIDAATDKLKEMPRYNALDKETQALKAKERSYM